MSEVETQDAVDRFPLSFNQEFLCQFDPGDGSGPFGSRYHLKVSLRLTGPVDVGVLRDALADVVQRHEPLRTRIVRDGSERYQRVFAADPPELRVREDNIPAPEREPRIEAVLREIESTSMDPDVLPLLRAVLVRFDPGDSVLVLTAHHLATDSLSMRVLARDLAAFYAARRSGVAPQLPILRPYREFVAWERGNARYASWDQAVRYWATALRGARLTALRTDHPRSAKLPPVTARHQFTIEADQATEVRRLAREARCSPFMVLLAAYYRLVQRVTGASDVVVPTHTPGRGGGRFNETVGSFFNFLPLRIDLADCRSVGDLLVRTRTTCLSAYAHDIPVNRVFEVAPDLMAPAAQDDFAPVSFQLMSEAGAGVELTAADVSFTEINVSLTSSPETTDIPDGALWSIGFDPAGHLIGVLLYRTDRFDEHTVVRLVDGYRAELRALLAASVSEKEQVK